MTQTFYDDRGRVYEVRMHEVGQTNGSTDPSLQHYLATRTWYDDRNNIVKSQQPGGLVTKARYDGTGRLIEPFPIDGATTPALIASAFKVK